MSKALWNFKNHPFKFLLLAAFSLTAVVIIGLGIWSISLNERITEGLRTKHFLPPTQYFTAPETIYPDMLISRADFIHKLQDRKYEQKSLQERLHHGEFAFGPAEDCSQILATPLPEGTSSCVLFLTKEDTDPDVQALDLQMLIFHQVGSEEWPLQAMHGNPLAIADQVSLESTIAAQYLGKEPIQQNYTPLGDMPVACLNAVLSIEDPKFLEHNGVSLTAIARAAFRNLTGGRFAQGGSTITQQMVKNYFLTAEKSIKRKATEFLMSLLLEAHASKDEIFETYLNIIYLGQNGPFQIRGFPAAASYYFGKNIQSLNNAECATLAAVLNSPGLYDPFRKPENATKRRNLVLEKMLDNQYLSKEEMQAAQATPLQTHAVVNVAETAPYYIDAVQREMNELSIKGEGLKIYTGLDMNAQALAQKAVIEQLQHLEADNKFIKALRAKGKSLEASLLSVDNRTGLIKAIVGGRSYRLTQFNRAVDGKRQVGSIMKPFVYLSALESSAPEQPFVPTTIVHDKRFTHEYNHQSWSPENYGHEYFGDVPMFFALKSSLNCATAELGLRVGLKRIIETAQATGIQSRLEPVPSITLGAFELSPREVLQSYSTFASFGELRTQRALRSVVSEDGQVIYHSNQSVTNVLTPEPTAVLVGMMKQTLLTGTAKASQALGFHYPAAGKTGTTSDYRDSWFAGFTPTTTTVVWVGYDDNTSHNLTGGSGALPIWVQFMKGVLAGQPAVDFKWPEGVVTKQLDDKDKTELVFVKGTENL